MGWGLGPGPSPSPGKITNFIGKIHCNCHDALLADLEGTCKARLDLKYVWTTDKSIRKNDSFTMLTGHNHQGRLCSRWLPLTRFKQITPLSDCSKSITCWSSLACSHRSSMSLTWWQFFLHGRPIFCKLQSVGEMTFGCLLYNKRNRSRWLCIVIQSLQGNGSTL